MVRLLLTLSLLTDTAKYKTGDTVYHVNFHKKFVVEKVEKRKHGYYYLGWTLNCKEWEWISERVIKSKK